MNLDELKTKLLRGEFANLTLNCNDFKSGYKKMADYLEVVDDESFISPEEKQLCIDTDTLWTLQWYPDTPVGFYVIRASTFAAIWKYISDNKAEEWV